MNFDLYKRFSRQEIIAEIEHSPPLIERCDGHFIFTPSHLVCLSSICKSEWVSHFPYPSRFCWVPDRDFKEGIDPLAWVPPELIQASSPKRLSLLFALDDESSNFIFLGSTKLLSYGKEPFGPQQKERRTVEFYLTPKLPIPLWNRYGRYGEWLLYINGRTIAVLDRQQLEQETEFVETEDDVHFAVTRYEEDVLTILANKYAATVLYSRFPGDSGVTVANPIPLNSQDTLTYFTSGNGEITEFPIEKVIPRDQAFRILRDFVNLGKLPDWARWKQV